MPQIILYKTTEAYRAASRGPQIAPVNVHLRRRRPFAAAAPSTTKMWPQMQGHPFRWRQQVGMQEQAYNLVSKHWQQFYQVFKDYPHAHVQHAQVQVHVHAHVAHVHVPHEFSNVGPWALLLAYCC